MKSINRIIVATLFSFSLFSTTASTNAIAADRNQMIGQMLMMGFQGGSAKGASAKRLANQIKKGQVGSVVFLGYNFKSKSSVKQLTSLFKNAAGSNRLFIALDMEGGSVQRLGRKLGYPSIPSARSIAKKQSPAQAKSTYKKLASISKSAGFNMNLGPVVDLLINPRNPVIAKWNRAYSADPKKVIEFARSFVKAHKEAGIITVLKHFPGHGSSIGDSHEGFVNISSTWKNKELDPFNQLIKSGDAPAIMPGHLIHKRIASDGVPVSISKPAISGLLRKKLNYSGLVISDDLQMGAIAKNYSYKNTIIRAVNAGVDILMISNSRKPDANLPAKTIALISKAIDEGKIAPGKIESAYKRIMRAKATIK
ncbi:MAG: glycoside hydrolase family 3 N-terminal domain-containing protein [Hyphomicrobiales bacterium]